MSLQAETEAALVAVLEGAVSGIDAEPGPRTVPEIESRGRFGSVRNTSSTSERLEYGQLEWTETYAVTLYWSAVIGRETAAEEWEAIKAALLANPNLGGVILGVYDAFVSDALWGESHDAGVRTMTAAVTVSRVE